MLSNQSCEACQSDTSQVTDDEIAELIKQIPNWVNINENGILKLRCKYQFKDYLQALHFTNQVAHLAETEDHHPDILLQWGKVTVTWWSHNIKGLHKNDFIMAAKTDQVVS